MILKLKPSDIYYMYDFCFCGRFFKKGLLERFLVNYTLKDYNRDTVKDLPHILFDFGSFFCKKCKASYDICKCYDTLFVYKITDFVCFDNVKNDNQFITIDNEYFCDSNCLEFYLEKKYTNRKEYYIVVYEFDPPVFFAGYAQQIYGMKEKLYFCQDNYKEILENL